MCAAIWDAVSLGAASPTRSARTQPSFFNLEVARISSQEETLALTPPTFIASDSGSWEYGSGGIVGVLLIIVIVLALTGAEVFSKILLHRVG